MILEGKGLTDLTEADLLLLIEHEVPEGKLLDYKSQLPGPADSDKKEFLFDISSFANASGGFLIYGIEEDRGIPLRLSGISLSDADAEIRRLESLVLDGIEPRIQGVEFRCIPVRDAKQVLMIRIPKSWQLPHMVVLKGADKFYTRNSAGKHRLDVSELRSLFSVAGTLAEQIKKFRMERLGSIIANETPVTLNAGAKLILHLIPFESFSPNTRINLRQAERIGTDLWPLGASGYNNRFNLDGLLHHDEALKATVNSYLQLYHNGIIETVDTNILRLNLDVRLIASTFFEQKLGEHISKYLSAFQKLNVPPPFVVMLSLVGVKGYGMAAHPTLLGGARIDRDVLILPEMILNKMECRFSDLKPILDGVWNAAGWPESKNFDADGNYIAG